MVSSKMVGGRRVNETVRPSGGRIWKIGPAFRMQFSASPAESRQVLRWAVPVVSVVIVVAIVAILRDQTQSTLERPCCHLYGHFPSVEMHIIPVPPALHPTPTLPICPCQQT